MIKSIKNIDNTLSKHQMGYQKGYSSQHSLIAMFEKWKENLDKEGECGALFVDLSKAIGCLKHDRLLTKLNAYGFDYKSLKLISSFLSNRKYRTKINSRRDTTPYAFEKKLYDVQRKLDSESLILFEWFHDNYLKANSGKSHVMLTTDNKLKINVKDSPISNEKIVKLLGVTVDNKLSFQPHLNLVCKSKTPCPC